MMSRGQTATGSRMMRGFRIVDLCIYLGRQPLASLNITNPRHLPVSSIVIVYLSLTIRCIRKARSFHRSLQQPLSPILSFICLYVKSITAQA